jgi:hypothetical protein
VDQFLYTEVLILEATGNYMRSRLWRIRRRGRCPGRKWRYSRQRFVDVQTRYPPKPVNLARPLLRAKVLRVRHVVECSFGRRV